MPRLVKGSVAFTIDNLSLTMREPDPVTRYGLRVSAEPSLQGTFTITKKNNTKIDLGGEFDIIVSLSDFSSNDQIIKECKITSFCSVSSDMSYEFVARTVESHSL